MGLSRSQWSNAPYAHLERYGLTLDQYKALLEKQGGVCAVCGNGETSLGRSGRVKALAVDHDHETGRVRGLLCHGCNVALGCLKDDPERIMRLALYAARA